MNQKPRRNPKFQGPTHWKITFRKRLSRPANFWTVPPLRFLATPEGATKNSTEGCRPKSALLRTQLFRAKTMNYITFTLNCLFHFSSCKNAVRSTELSKNPLAVKTGQVQVLRQVDFSKVRYPPGRLHEPNETNNLGQKSCRRYHCVLFQSVV